MAHTILLAMKLSPTSSSPLYQISACHRLFLGCRSWDSGSHRAFCVASSFAVFFRSLPLPVSLAGAVLGGGSLVDGGGEGTRLGGGGGYAEGGVGGSRSSMLGMKAALLMN